MRAQQNVAFNDIGAVDTDPFQLTGGTYVVDAISGTWGGGNTVLQRLGPNGSTWIPTHTALLANGVTAVLYLPPGQYRVSITTAINNYVNISRVPHE